jgi:hypothetical protein
MKKMFFLWILVLVLFISGCGQRPPQEIRIGGLDISFLKDRPPRDVIYENQDFSIGVQIVNNVPTEVLAEVCVSDTPADSYGGVQGEICDNLVVPGATEYGGEIEPYEMEPIYFDPEPYINLGRGVDSTNILATVTYSLETTSDIDICLAKDFNFQEGDFRCESESVFSGKDIRSAKAPLIVDRVESRIVPEGDNNRVILDIYFKKSPIGRIIDRKSNKQLFDVDVYFGATSAEFKCNPLVNGKVEMSGPSRKITCYALANLEEVPYVDTLHIDLSYSYRVSISTGSIKLEKIYKGGDTEGF